MATAKTTNPTISIFDALTGQLIEREMNAEELANYEATNAEAAARNAERDAKATARTSALAKLAAIGLTQEEIDSL
jgi:TorA maturation chaperone TorD